MKGLGVKEPTIFDVGANVGQTVERYKRVFETSTIYSFEPHPDMFDILQREFADDANVRPINEAVSEQRGTSTFFINKIPNRSSLLPRERSVRWYDNKGTAQETCINVTVTTIDDFVEVHNIENVDILKMDIQGGELMALRGATQTLEKEKVSLIYTEFHAIPHYHGGSLLYQTWGYLERFGYTLFDLYNFAWASNGQLRFGDALFISKHVRSAYLNRLPEQSS